MKLALRDYQELGITQIADAFRSGFNAVFYQLPTGGGKSLIFTSIAHRMQQKGTRAFVLVHRKELLNQAREHFRSNGIHSGEISGGRSMALTWPIQVGSVQTVVRRLDALPTPDLIICDEGHHGVSETYTRIFAHWPRARILRVSATPWRMGSKGVRLTQRNETLICGPSMRELIDRGFLAQPMVYAPPLGETVQQELDDVATVGGDYSAEQQAAILNKPTITGCAVSHYQSILGNRPAIAFCPTLQHGQGVVEGFNQRGLQAALIEGGNTDLERKRMIGDLARGHLNVLVSVELIGEGVDIPVVAGSIMLRRTKSLVVYLQQAGRALRKYPGKDVGFLLDHVGNAGKLMDGHWKPLHGLPDEDREWSLDPLKKKRGNKGDAPPPQSLRTCPQCWCTHPPMPKCPGCGHTYLSSVRKGPEAVDGSLVAITPDLAKARKQQRIRSARTMQELLDVAKEYGFNPRWAYKLFKERSAAHARHR